MFVLFIAQVALLVVTVGVVLHFSLNLRKQPVMHNKCYTDNLKIESTHGHTEPHIKLISIILGFFSSGTTFSIFMERIPSSSSADFTTTSS